MRRFAEHRGLPTPDVRSLVQDDAGFLWIGTVGGLYRYDGVEMRRWAPETLHFVSELATAGGAVVALDDSKGVYAVGDTGVAPVREADGSPFTDVRSIAFDPTGRLWVAHGARLSVRSAVGAWTDVSVGAAKGERLRHLRDAPSGGVFMLTERAVWLMGTDRPPRRLGAVRRPEDVLARADGSHLVVGWYGELYELRDGIRRRVLAFPGRGIELLRRGETTWVAYARHLIALRPDRPPEVLGPEHGIEGGGRLLLDQEGSLWLGTFTGLFQFPEPETVFWHDRHGLPSAHTRFLTRTGDTVWVSTWQGLGLLTERDDGWVADTAPVLARHRLFRDATGVLWIPTPDGLAALPPTGGLQRYPLERGAIAIESAGSGRLWVGTREGLLLFDRRRGARQVPIPPLGGSPLVQFVLQDGDGHLWLTSREHVCRAHRDSVLSAPRSVWACDTIPGAVDILTLRVMPSGDVWAVSERLGVLRYHGGDWEVVPGTATLRSRAVHNLVSSPRGGVWIVGTGTVIRVRERPESRLGWKVLERLTPWHGLPGTGAGGVLEDEDGTVWLATSRGVVRVPPDARAAPVPPPRVQVVEALADDRPISLDGTATLPHRQNRVDLRFAALSFRDPVSIRYQVRLLPDREWRSTRGEGEPVFRFVDLRSGRHRAEVRASLDGRTWSPTPAVMAFEVHPPWYLRWWVLVLFAAAVVTLLALIYRARVTFLLGLERQRTRIAMDLHDEMGSGLGSVGILAGVLAHDELPRGERRRMAESIADTAAELGAALSDIVWSLDPRASTLDELAGRLAEHGRRLFASQDVEFATRFPQGWPSARVAFPVRRNVLLIGLEALHNAAQHAQARRVVLSLTPRGPDWEFAVEDDGVGLPAPVRLEAGVGLASMRHRAEEIGATIACDSSPGRGTIVRLRFSLHGPPDRLLPRLRSRRRNVT